MNPITRIAPVTDEEAARMARPDTLSDLARQIAATPITTGHGASARSCARNRPRPLLLGVPLAAGLAAAAVVVAAIGVPGAGHNGTDLTAYVVKRVDGALSAAEPSEIAQMTVTMRSVTMARGTTVTSTAEEWSYGDQWRSFINLRAGRPGFDEGFSTASVYTVVNYQAQTWARQHESGVPAAPTPVYGSRGCQAVASALPLLFQPVVRLSTGVSAGSLPATVATALRTAISCGTLAVASRQLVGGIEAIELTSRPGSPISEIIWVSAGTYLPVRVIARPAPGKPGLLTADIAWLPPTARNMARLIVPIPAGFRQAPAAEVTPTVREQAPKSG